MIENEIWKKKNITPKNDSRTHLFRLNKVLKCTFTFLKNTSNKKCSIRLSNIPDFYYYFLKTRLKE